MRIIRGDSSLFKSPRARGIRHTRLQTEPRCFLAACQQLTDRFHVQLSKEISCWRCYCLQSSQVVMVTVTVYLAKSLGNQQGRWPYKTVGCGYSWMLEEILDFYADGLGFKRWFWSFYNELRYRSHFIQSVKCFLVWCRWNQDEATEQTSLYLFPKASFLCMNLFLLPCLHPWRAPPHYQHIIVLKRVTTYILHVYSYL